MKAQVLMLKVTEKRLARSDDNNKSHLRDERRPRVTYRARSDSPGSCSSVEEFGPQYGRLLAGWLAFAGVDSAGVQ